MEQGLELQHQLDLTNIYLCLSEQPQRDFDTNNYLTFVFECIEKHFSDSFLKLESNEISYNPLKVNQNFLDLMTFCRKENQKDFDAAYVFVGFCDYFNLDEQEIFGCLHKKLQAVIRNYAKKIIGEKLFYQTERKVNGTKDYFVPNIFQVTKR